MKKIVVRGFKKEKLSPEEMQEAKDSKLELKASYQFSTSRAAAPIHELEFDKTDILEFVFDDNTTWVGSSDIIHDIFPEAANQKRAVGDSFVIPMYLQTDEANRSLLGDIALKALNVFAKKAVSQKVIEIAARLEKKALENMSGVYAINPDFKLTKATVKNADKPYLLFLHGTNSSTAGSFGELRGSELWKNMQGIYGQNIIGLQHETMTKSPIQNVINLFKSLPEVCTLHVISHSRGGLVGDVLARFCNGNTGFTNAELAYLTKTERTADIADIKTLQQLVTGKTINVDKFIRVACPAYGTTVLSKRLDHFLNISLNLLGTLFGPVGIALTAEFKELISAAVDTKNDPDQLPGLEAMNPASPFLKVLNNPDNIINSPLTVISGNCGITFNLKGLLIIASKLFYLRDNDLVVDTKSMYCGTRRNIPIQYFFDEGAEVDHVHYFKNKKTQDALLMALKTATTATTIPNFITYQQSLQAALERNALLGLDGGGVYTDKVTGKKPIAILLPGIMGSNLDQGKNKVWINYLRFLVGDLNKLDISKKDILASSLIKTSYKKLVDFLSTDYDVVTFPFDWRMPLTEAAELLKARIEQYLVFKVPIKIIGHSMGGVVTRDFIINYPATWKKLNASKDFKLVLLGAPLGGSYRIPYVLAGKDSIINQLSKIDLKHTKKELLDMFRKYPGLLALLPIAKDVDFADEKIWLSMRNASLFDWNIPDKKDLQFWGNYRDNVLAKMDSIDMENVVYIAGKDDATVCGFEINNQLPDEKIIFKSTAEGDQSVTWETGIPKKLLITDRLYYVNVSHGALANNADIFNGIAEILKTGKTELLSRSRPVLRGAQPVEFDTVEEEVYETDELSLEKNILGIKEKPVTERAATVPLKVSVSNGDLFYSRYPIMVGHFINDGITSAEKVIDNYSGSQLSQRLKLNMYPGGVGSNEVFVNFKNEFKGTVVIGLGAPGRLSSYQLTQTTEQGVIKYMLELINLYKKNETAWLPAETGISVLLIGCGYGGLSIESSIRSIVLGVQNANKKMEEFATEGLRLIEHIEFVELFEDRCMQCLYILSRIENEEDSTINIRVPKKQYKKLLGSRTRIPMENETDWWSRITVQLCPQKEEGSDVVETALRFACSTGSAREEERDLQTSPEIINELIEEMSTNNNWNAGIAKTVFELLIPNDFKDEVKKQSNSLWVLDHAAASYPWELLQDSTNARPLCCSAGMIRQLKLEDYRIKVDGVVGKKALVVGDPDLNGFPYAAQLPGAFKEGNLVASILGEYGYEMPNNCFKKSSTQIINALFKDEYKIIHLAGHGIFNEKRPKASGMLIGNGVFLSTKEICQMSKVPELVFVNCCFLGKVDATSEALFSKRYKLAANIGTQLISNGVKVVIAAGWAVDDAAALHFTNIFYHSMLSGYNFGDAVKYAREKTYDKHPNTNTWGAYQCYGDPYFKLSDKKLKPEPKKYFIAQEAENDLGNLINRCDSKGSSVKNLLKDIGDIVTAVDAAGIRNACITEREAMAYAECNEYENAIACFEKLLNMEKAGFSVTAIEKYCNVSAKLAVKNWQIGIKKSEQMGNMEKVISNLEQLLNIGEKPTAERLSLLGSAYKRKAMILANNTERVKALIISADYYKKAYSKQDNSNKTYSLINWLEIEKILQLAKNLAGLKTVIKKYKFETVSKTKELIDDAVKKLINTDADIDFWNEIGKANALLCAWLMEGKNGKELTDKIVVDAYKRVWNIAGSQNKKVSELEHFDFLISAYSGLVKRPAIVIAIKKIKQDLEKIIK